MSLKGFPFKRRLGLLRLPKQARGHRSDIRFLFLITLFFLAGCQRPGEQAQQHPPPPITPAKAAGIEARLTYLEGPVSLTRDKARLPAELDMALLPGDTVETGKDAQAEVTFDDSSTLDLDPETRFGISELARDSASGQRTVRTSLLSGELQARIAKLAQNSTFEIESPTSVAAVRGTEFIVAYRPGQPTQVTVLVGRVGVRRPRIKEAEVILLEHHRLAIHFGKRPGKPIRLALGDEDLIRVKWKRWHERKIKVMERLRPRRAVFGPGMPKDMKPKAEKGKDKPSLPKVKAVPKKKETRNPSLKPKSPKTGGTVKKAETRRPSKPSGGKPGEKPSDREKGKPGKR